MGFVEVAVNSGMPHRGSFSYAVPEGMTLVVGDGVFVPFGRRFLQGIVVDVVDVPAFSEPKPVDSKLDGGPIISPERVKLAQWLADYYLAPLFACVALMLPPGFERKPLTFYESLVGAEEVDVLRAPPRQRELLEFIIERGRIEAKDIEKDSKLKGVTAALGQLATRGLVQRSYGFARPSVRQKTMRYVDLTAPTGQVLAAIEDAEAGRKGKVAAALRLLLEDGPSMPAADLRVRVGATLPTLRSLAEAGLIALRDEGVQRDPLAGRSFEMRPSPHLTDEQELSYEVLKDAIDAAKGETFLLHGVTGSGKTEVYLRALEHTVALGKRGIVLVPEIALTPQTVRRFAERFPGQVAVLHSGLSQGELFDQWHGIKEGRYAVVVGSRSAIFAPQPDLGLIVIDEEHEWTYKQDDRTPRYHARAAAEELAKLCGATLVLGSATPDVESYQRALWGRYRLLELKERVRPVRDASGVIVQITTSTVLPPVEVVDMRDELKSGNRSIFSRPLQLGLFNTMNRGEQAILFLNRRGSAGFLQCRDCGYVPQCSSCAIALGYHKHFASDGSEVERLLCHQCNRPRGMLSRCPMCASPRLRPMGLGVERVEESLAELLPGVRSLRWDRDVTRGKHSHEQILQSFLQGEADVLVGTQMVAKGLDLPEVTLVGVISADIGLHIPDFRAAERTFQLLTQVAGRAGRTASIDGGPPRGSVVIQTYTPDNYAIIAAAQHDFESFFAHEVELRRQEAYPPFVRLARLVYAHGNADYGQRQAEKVAQQLRRDVSTQGIPGVEVLGPAPPHIPKWHGRTRWQLTLRAPDPAALLRDFKLGEGWTMDIDPSSIA